MSQISLFDGASPLKITKPIRLIECFAGYGSQALSLKYLGVPFEHWRIAEWAVKSIQAYKDMHFPDDDTDYSKEHSTDWLIEYLFNKGISADYNKPMTKAQITRTGENKIRTVYNNIIATNNLVSVTNVRGEDLDITDTDKYTYILTYSFPCFTADTLVLTNKGYKRIVDICVGDYVLTHTNTYQRVTATFDNGEHEVWLVKGMGVDEIKTTGNHKFYVREKRKQGQKRVFGAPLWKQVRDITNDDYMGIAINQENKLPEWDGVEHIWSDGRASRKSNILNGMFHTEDFWYVIGRYLADGWIRSQGGVVICSGQGKKRELERRVQNLFGYSLVNERTVCKIHIPLKELGAFVEQFGRGANNKRLTNAIFDLPRDLLSAFLDGYLSGDGYQKGGVVKATSTSRELIYGVAQCVAKAYHTPYAIYHTKRNPTCVIEGRTVNQHDTFELVFKTEKRKQDRAFYEDGFVWYPINTISQIGIERVYDIEVENDHSFTAQNTIVHNCQDLSNAGLRKGMAKGSGTRSGLLWEIERILDECTELPQILLMENVPDVIGKKNFAHFTEWYGKLESLGYKSWYKVMNAKEYGMPQNRERCFMVSALGDHYYEFPKTVPLELRPKDLLEPDVDEKYYLSENALQGMFHTTHASGTAEENPQLARVIGGIGEKKSNGGTQWYQQDRIYEGDIAMAHPASLSPQGSYYYRIAVPSATTHGYEYAEDGDSINLAFPNSKTRRGRVWHQVAQTILTATEQAIVCYDEQNNRFREGGTCGTLTADGNSPKHNNRVVIWDGYNQRVRTDSSCVGTLTRNCGADLKRNGQGVIEECRIRKLTPRECFRWMGVKDEDFERVAANQSDSSLYHLAGDSIVTNCLVAIFKEML